MSDNLENFNNEVVWDNNYDLFEQYYETIILEDRHPISKLTDDTENMPFSIAVNILKK